MAINYLNNKDILKQIHLSKNSYCSVAKEGYDRYDIILPSLDKINRRTTAQAKRNKALRLQKESYEKAKLVDKKVKQADFEVKWQKIDKHDLIFRIMTYDHIPLEAGRKRKPKTEADHRVKINFPPFQHYKLVKDDKLKCIGKSHWVGSMSNGKFYAPLEHPEGKMTDELARMFLKLCKRYATRANWRGYTANDEMQSQALLQLSQIGLQFDESKSDNPFAYYTAAITNSFTRILNIEKKNQNIRDDLLELAQMKPSSTRQNLERTSTPIQPKK